MKPQLPPVSFKEICWPLQPLQSIAYKLHFCAWFLRALTHFLGPERAGWWGVYSECSVSSQQPRALPPVRAVLFISKKEVHSNAKDQSSLVSETADCQMPSLFYHRRLCSDLGYLSSWSTVLPLVGFCHKVL